MKTTIDLPDDLLRMAKAEAALEGISLKDLVTVALEERLGSTAARKRSKPQGWRTAFGIADRRQVASVDKIVDRDLEMIDAAEWD